MAFEPFARRIIARGRYVCVVVASITLVAGCGSMAARTGSDYDRGASPAEKLAADADSCAKQAEAHTKQYGMGPYDMTHGSYNFMYDSCMQAVGYERKKPAP